MPRVTAEDLARQLGVPGRTLRAWLRRRWRAGDPLLDHHRLHDRWLFSESDAAILRRAYASGDTAR